MVPVWTAHFGGLWEAAVKSTKLSMRKIFGTIAELHLDEIYTIVC